MERWRWRLSRLRRLDRRRRALLLEAVVWLGMARLLLLVVPFPRIARRLGRFLPPEEGRHQAFPVSPPPEQADLAGAVGWAVSRAARHMPFQAVCLPQAMAAKVMLGRRGVPSVLSFGLTKTLKGVESHAWLAAAGVEVTGYPVRHDFTEIGCFF